jgi:Tol biopolymer transport system component
MAGRGPAADRVTEGHGMTDGTGDVPVELVVDGATALEPVISPDGRWVAYTVRPVSRRAERLAAIWLAATDASVPPRALTP